MRLTVPYIKSETILGIQTLTDLGAEDTTGFLGLPSGPPRFQKLRWTSGFGDATLGVTRKFNRVFHSPAYFDTVLKMRLPTGQSARGFGIAGTDILLNGEFGGDWAWGGIYGDAGYRVLADTPVFTRHNGFQAGFGGWANLTHRDQLGGYFEWHEHSLTRDPSFGLIGGYYAHRIIRSFKIQVYGGVGLSNSSPGEEVGLSFIYRPAAREH